MEQAKVDLKTQQESDQEPLIQIVTNPNKTLNNCLFKVCDLLNNFNVGQPVKIGINLRGREWTNPQGETKYFNSIQGWRIENLQPAAPQGGNTPPPADHFEPAQDFNEEDHDDLPF